MRRIVVIGTTEFGKMTPARELSAKAGILCLDGDGLSSGVDYIRLRTLQETQAWLKTTGV